MTSLFPCTASLFSDEFSISEFSILNTEKSRVDVHIFSKSPETERIDCCLMIDKKNCFKVEPRHLEVELINLNLNHLKWHGK